ncbi:MAG TPA: hypothetical protein DD803_15925 [Alcaligenes faecalis]|nr:hypothetical protein [Alcaligenes faecalis]HBQ90924.1 hypothetical protein [Alcaligenes faecalis]
MDTNLDVHNRERPHGLNGKLRKCKAHIIDIVLLEGTAVLEERIQKIQKEIIDQKIARYADVLLSGLIRHRILDEFRKIEAPMRAVYERFTEANQTWESTRLATQEATHAWDLPAKDFRSKLQVLVKWAESAALAWDRRSWPFEPSPFKYAQHVIAPSWLKTPNTFVKHRDILLQTIDFIREMSDHEVLEGRLDWPVGLSEFERSLKTFEAAQARAEAHQREETEAKATLESAKRECIEEQLKAIALLQPLSETEQLALYHVCWRE